MDGQPSFLDDLAQEKPESFREEIFVPSRGRWKRLLPAILLLVLIVPGFLLFRGMTAIRMPDMTGWNADALHAWIKGSHPETSLKEIYDKETSAGKVLSQQPPAGSRIHRNTPVTIVSSLGANPSDSVPFPDLKKMTLSQIRTWTEQEKLNGVTIRFEENGLVPKDTVINYELVDGTADQFLRKSRVIVYVSSGNGKDDITFSMPDLAGKTRAEALRWAAENKVAMTVEEVYDAVYEAGTVISQSIKKDTKIKRSDAVHLVLSKGSPVTVPDFLGLSRTEASDLAGLRNMKVFFRYQESTKAVDTVLSQDVAPGIEMDRQTVVTLLLSKKNDRITVPDFRGLPAAEAESLAALSGLKVFLRNRKEAGEDGTVQTQSEAPGKTIRNDAFITLSLTGSGMATVLPDFTGLSKSQATAMAQNLGLTPVFNEVRDTSAKNGTVLHQGLAAGKAIGKDKALLLDIAVNSGVTAVDLTSLSKEDAEAWAKQNGVAMRFVDRYNDVLPAGTLFGQDIIGRLIPENGTVTLQHSLGRVGIGDFIGKQKLDILAWQNEVNAKGASIVLVFTADSGTTLPKGSITSQSVKSDELSLLSSITVGISSTDNTGVKIPSLENMEVNEFKSWCAVNGVTYSITERYNDDFKAGRVCGQSHQNGFLPKGEYLRVNVSLGHVHVGDFAGKDKSAVFDWQEEVNRQGASIGVSFGESWSATVPAGKIIAQSVTDNDVRHDATIVFTLSKGPEPVPSTP